MKHIPFLILILCLAHAVVLGQKRWTEVDLTVNDIKSGTSYSTILKRIGKPLRVRKIGFDECGGGYRKVLYYSGLNIGLLSDAKRRNYTVMSMEVSSSRWKIAPSIKIGATKKAVRTAYGAPIGSYQPPDNVLDYVTKENLGGVTFYFKNNKLIRVTMMETLC